MRIDGDAARVARREARDDEVVYTLGGVDYQLPVEIPLDVLELEDRAVAEAWSTRRYRLAMLEALLGEQWQAFRATPGLSGEDIEAAWSEVLAAYGVTQGESSSSPDSSAPGGERSKRSSNGSTRSTRARSGRKAASAGS